MNPPSPIAAAALLSEPSVASSTLSVGSPAPFRTVTDSSVIPLVKRTDRLADAAAALRDLATALDAGQYYRGGTVVEILVRVFYFFFVLLTDRFLAFLESCF